MIIKRMSRKANIGRTINYLFKDNAKLEKEGHKPIIIRKNLRTRKLEKVIKEFEKNETSRKYKRSDAVKLYHTVISFHKKDSQYLNDKVLKDFAREYMKERGDNLYIATAHFDKDHVHLHVCESGTRYMTGMANRVSKQELKQLTSNMQEFQKNKYPQLSHSLPRHEKAAKGGRKEQIVSVRHTQKQRLLARLKEVEKTSKSMDELLGHLSQAGFEPYYRGGRLTGVKNDTDIKFRFSSVGYDKEKMAEISQRFEEERQLEEIEDLRSSTSASKEAEQESKSRALEEEEPDEQNDTDMEPDDDDYSR